MIFKKLFSVILIGALALPVTRNVTAIAGALRDNEFQYLIYGFDDVSDNTDVIIAFNYDVNTNDVSIVQIPRDTYCSYESENSKINHLYSHFRFLGLSDKEALARVTEFIGNQLGVSFDGYLGITTEGFRNSVDAIGGVCVLLNERFVYESRDPSRSFVLEPGENTLNGEQAEVFVRYRSGYLTGDLGRLDTQKIFLEGLFETLSSVNGYDEAFSILRKIQKNVITDFSAVELLTVIIKHSSKFKMLGASYLTMPGEASPDKNGISYYVLNRASCEEVIEKYLSPVSEFDRDRRFLSSDNLAFREIYLRDRIEYKVYTSGEVNGIKVPKKH
jgi:LCP family protein required for cell wall assembly